MSNGIIGKDLRAEQQKLDRGHDGQHGQRRKNGLPPEIRGDRNVHALMKVSSSSSEMKSKYPEENVQNMTDMFRVCESLYAELRSLEIEDNYYEAFSIHLSGADHALYCRDMRNRWSI